MIKLSANECVGRYGPQEWQALGNAKVNTIVLPFRNMMIGEDVK